MTKWAKHRWKKIACKHKKKKKCFFYHYNVIDHDLYNCKPEFHTHIIIIIVILLCALASSFKHMMAILEEHHISYGFNVACCDYFNIFCGRVKIRKLFLYLELCTYIIVESTTLHLVSYVQKQPPYTKYILLSSFI